VVDLPRRPRRRGERAAVRADGRSGAADGGGSPRCALLSARVMVALPAMPMSVSSGSNDGMVPPSSQSRRASATAYAARPAARR